MDVILIPGLGKNHNERMFLWLRPLWRLYGIRLHVCEINWEDGRSFASKYQRLEKLASSLNNLVGVVGASAGASAAVRLLADHLTTKVITVCGLLEVDYLDEPAMQKRSPAFLEALTGATCDLTDDKTLAANMLTIRPLADGIVSPEVATTPGAHDIIVKTSGHALSIAYILTFKIGLIKQFLASP